MDEELEIPPLLNPIEGDSVMSTTATEEQLILKTMNDLPIMANERGKDYAKRITSRVDIMGNILFGIVLPEGGRVDVGTVNPLTTVGLALLNDMNALLDNCDVAWLAMTPTAPPSTNTEPTNAMTPAEVKAYEAKVTAEAEKELRNEAADMRKLFNESPKIEYEADKVEYINYNGFDLIVYPGVVSYIPEPWYNILMDSKKADRKRGNKASQMKNLETHQLDAVLSRKGLD